MLGFVYDATVFSSPYLILNAYFFFSCIAIRIDVDTSTMIVERKIGLKSGVEIKEYGVKFTDGSELTAEAIVYATGYPQTRNPHVLRTQDRVLLH